MATTGYKTATVIAGIIAAVLLVALLVRTVIDELEYQRQADFAYLPDYSYVFYSMAPISLAAIVAGFGIMRKASVLGVLLVTSGSVAIAIMTYWLIVPIFLAVGLSAYAFRRAGRIVT